MLIFHLTHVTATGQTTRRVTCERCRNVYEYQMSRKAALDTIPLPALIRSAERICGERVAKRLAKDIDPIPCPSCGWMQSEMMPEVRRRFARWLDVIGRYFIVACAALVVFAATMGVWNRINPFLDVEWFLMAAVFAAGCALGGLILLFRALLGRLRYPFNGFMGKSRGVGSLVRAN